MASPSGVHAATTPGPAVADSMAALRQSLGPLRTFVLLCDDHGRVTWVNAFTQDALGDRLAGVLDRPLEEGMARSLDPARRPSYDDLGADHRFADRTWTRLAVADGSVRTIAWSRTGIDAGAGLDVGTILIGIDVTDEVSVGPEPPDAFMRATGLADAAAPGIDRLEKRLRRRVADQESAAAELQYRIAFENLITTLSTEFISLKPEEIDRGIERALRRIGGFTGDDRSWVVLYRDGTIMENTYEWCAGGVHSCKPALDSVPLTTSPWCNDRLLRGEVVHIPDTAQLPEEARADIRLFAGLGTKSTIIVPMVYQRTTIGSLGFDSVRRGRTWSQQTIVLLRAVGEMFVNTLERKWVEEELQESRQALVTLMDNLPGMAFRLCDGRGTYDFVSDGCIDLTGHEPAELIGNPDLAHLHLVHPGDRPAVRRALRCALRDRAAYHSTHRIVVADGDVKWVMEHGRGVVCPRLRAPVLEGYSIDATDRVHAYQRLEERVEQRTREIERRRAVAEGLRDVVEMLNKNRPLAEVLDQVVGQAAQLLTAPASAVVRLRATERSLSFEAARGLRTHAALGGQFALTKRLVNDIASAHEVRAVGAIDGTPVHDELPRFLRGIHRKSMTGACRALLVVPLALAVDEYGLLVNFYPAKREFSVEEVELARMLGDQVILAVGNALLRQQAEETAIAQERGRIAGDLHDSVTQLLFSANLTAEALPSLLDGDLGGAKRSLDQLRSLTTRALAEMRALLLELRPSVIEESGLEQVLRSLVVAGSGRGGIPIRLTVHGALDLPHEVRVALYRIVQESLNNVIRHAHAHSAEVVITCKGHGVDVTVTDDGLGLDPNDVPAGHMGLRIMHERARAIGARLTVGCPPGGGTQVRVDWPASPKGGHS